MRQNQSPFRFRKNDNVGEASAELDEAYLADCFEDTGDLSILRNSTNKKRIILGRTGSGKTALLMRLADAEPNHIWINPDDLSLAYLSNSTILKSLSDLEIHLDRFFKLLWKHIFCIELIRHKFKINNEKDKQTFLTWLVGQLGGNKKKERALDYLNTWGESFFEKTEVRIKEITNKLESNVTSTLGAKWHLIEGRRESGDKISDEAKFEIVQRAQVIVNEIQVAELDEVFRILQEDILYDQMPPYFILIDKLDEDWVDDSFRYRLIRALIETVRDFVRVSGVKIILALRRDLVDRVFKNTRNPGTQREKFDSLLLDLSWNSEHLMDLVNRRINALIARKYSSQPLTYQEIMPSNIRKEKTSDYLVARTLYRPRDIIAFMNKCIEKAEGKTKIDAAIINAAEPEYSKSRFDALLDEWHADYPDLDYLSSILKNRPVTFPVATLEDDRICDLCLHIATKEPKGIGPLYDMAKPVAEGQLPAAEYRCHLICMFYRVGLIGLKTDAGEPVQWSYRHGAEIRTADVSNNTAVSMSPAFWRYLGTNTR